MALHQVPWPAQVRITAYSHELWSPGRIVHRLRDGSIDEPLDRASARWRGTVTLGAWGALGSAGTEAISATELLLAQLSDPEAWTSMPWGGASPRYFTVSNWSGRVTASAAGLHTLARQPADTTETIYAGEWLRAPSGRLVQVRTLAGTAAAPQITTLPVTVPAVGASFGHARFMQVRKRDPDDGGITMERRAGFGGGVTFQWEEL